METFLTAIWLVVTFGGNPVTLYPHESAPFVMRQGYVDCQVVYYVPFAASNYQLAKQLDQFVSIKYPWCNNGVEWAPALNCALECEFEDGLQAANSECEPRTGDVYMLNCGQCVVFSTQPGEEDYTPLWRVHYVEWKPRLPKICLCSEAEILQALDDGKLIEVIPPSVLDATIIIPTSKVPSVKLAYLNYAKKKVKFYCFDAFPPGPTFHYGNANGNNQIDNKLECFLITDTNDLDLALAVGANYAPELDDLAPDCCSCAAAFVNPTQPCQLPVLCETPLWAKQIAHNSTKVPWGNTNQNYNPVLCWTLFDRSPTTPLWSVFSTVRGIDEALANGSIMIVPTDEPIVTNSPLSNESVRKALPPPPPPP